MYRSSEGSQPDVCHDNETNDQRAIVSDVEVTHSADPERDRAIDRRMNIIAKILTLSIVYASNIGGTATLTGTPTNLIIADNANRSDASLNSRHQRLSVMLSLALVLGSP